MKRLTAIGRQKKECLTIRCLKKLPQISERIMRGRNIRIIRLSIDRTPLGRIRKFKNTKQRKNPRKALFMIILQQKNSQKDMMSIKDSPTFHPSMIKFQVFWVPSGLKDKKENRFIDLLSIETRRREKRNIFRKIFLLHIGFLLRRMKMRSFIERKFDQP